MLKNLRNTLSGLDRDELLQHLGLERKPDMMEKVIPALAIFGAGVAVGVGIGMIFAPRTGQELRGQLQSQLKRVEQKVRGAAEAATAGTSAGVPSRPA